VDIKGGVKQGDPLSPLLFNTCIDPLLDEVQRKSEGVSVNSENKVSVLAFADDIILLGNNGKEVQTQLNILNKYLGALNMKISGEKCFTFQVVPKKDTGFLKNPEIKLDNFKISFAEPVEAFKYLGAKMGPWKGMHEGIIIPELMTIVKRVRKLPLKPCQKIELLTNYIFPRYIYSMMINPSCEGVLKTLDNEIRQEIKGILYLVSSTATGFFYAPKVNGGLGLPRFEYIIKLGTLKNGIKFMNSSDPVVSSLIGSGEDRKLKRITNSLSIN
jgi:hypothetical protein